MSAPKRLILVCGSGRSGTSLLSGILKELGAHVPKPEVPPDQSNPKGFSESQWVVNLHRKMLRRVNVEVTDARPSAWERTAEIAHHPDVRRRVERWLREQFRSHDLVLIKDPRLLWFLDLWTSAGEPYGTPTFITALRHPLEVTRSKQTHYGTWSANAATVGWLNTMLFTEQATRDHRRVFVRYADLLTEAKTTVERIDAALGLGLVERAGEARMQRAAELVDPTLRRSADSTWESLGTSVQVIDMAEEAWKLFDRVAAATDPQDRSLAAEFDALRDRFVELYTFAESVAEASVLAASREWPMGMSTADLRVLARRGVGRAKRELRWRTFQRGHRERPPEGP